MSNQKQQVHSRTQSYQSGYQILGGVDFPVAQSKVVVRKGKGESSGSGFLGKLIPCKNKKPDLNIKRYDVVALCDGAARVKYT